MFILDTAFWTLFAQRLESIKSPVCNIYALYHVFPSEGGGMGGGEGGDTVPFGLDIQIIPNPWEFNRIFWHMGEILDI